MGIAAIERPGKTHVAATVEPRRDGPNFQDRHRHTEGGISGASLHANSAMLDPARRIAFRY